MVLGVGLAIGVAFVTGPAGDEAAQALTTGGQERAVVVPGCHNRGDCGAPLKGGLQITFTGWSCTSGFLARDTETRQPYLVTAGHCMAGSGLFARWAHHGIAIGRATLNAFRDGSAADAGAVAIEEADVSNELFRSSNVDVRSVTGWEADSLQTIGSEVCRSGGASGWTCGRITAADVDTTIAGRLIRHTWWTDFVSAAGDSGGPMLDHDGHLVGIVIATTATHSVYSTIDAIAGELRVRPCVDPTCG